MWRPVWVLSGGESKIEGEKGDGVVVWCGDVGGKFWVSGGEDLPGMSLCS